MATRQHVGNEDVDRRSLFIGSCIALIATSVAFATVGDVMGALKEEFVLTNLQVGYIGGAALWGFAVSNIIFAPLCDNLGMRFLVRLAFLGHVAGVAVMIFATGFTMLFAGALIIAMGNGLVEAACNPLVATLYPDDKTVKLNQFHVWFPGGAVIGGLAAYALTQLGIGSWELKLALILVPTAVYGYMLLFRLFPDTEGVQSGVSMGEMFKATFTSPIFLLMLFCMALTASIELGPNRWVPAVLQAGGIPGILVLVWISGLMAVLRYFAKNTVTRLSPIGILFFSSVVSGIGLYWLSYAETALMAFLSATVFAVGVTYFWPTMLGFVNERVPRTGALGLGLMGGMGMAVVGLVTAPLMGDIADSYAPDRMPFQETRAVMQQTVDEFPSLALRQGITEYDIQNAVDLAGQALAGIDENTQELPPLETANALRAIVSTGVDNPTVSRAQEILGRADNYGGRMSFRWVAPVSLVLMLIFGGIWYRDRRRDAA
ncbi:MAG: MFS transporter [Balneolaceae bacterium]|nr:MFS transporter [Balneolaceae bacterium]